jgi:chemotaxis protein CheC
VSDEGEGLAEPDAGAPMSLAAIRGLSERGLSRAAESLAGLLGYPVRFAGLEIRPIRSGPPPELADAAGGSTAAVRIAIHGQASGWILILLPLPTVYRFLQALMGTPAAPRELTATERSAIQEVGNIVASSFLSELGDRVGRRFLPSAPECHLAGAPEAVRDALAFVRGLGSDVLVVHAALEDGEGHIRGRIFIMPDVGAWETVGRGAASR